MVTEELPGLARRALRSVGDHGNDGAERIEKAIAAAESGTSGEIVPLLVRRSSTVGHVPLASFMLLLLCVFLFDLPGRMAELGGPYWAWLGACWLLAGGLALGLSRLDWIQRLLSHGSIRFDRSSCERRSSSMNSK